MSRSITYFEGLVIGATDEVAMADVIGPRDLGVGLAREGVAFQPGQLCEFAAEVGCGERSEITSNFSLALDYENVSMSSITGRKCRCVDLPIISHLVWPLSL